MAIKASTDAVKRLYYWRPQLKSVAILIIRRKCASNQSLMLTHRGRTANPRLNDAQHHIRKWQNKESGLTSGPII